MTKDNWIVLLGVLLAIFVVLWVVFLSLYLSKSPTCTTLQPPAFQAWTESTAPAIWNVATQYRAVVCENDVCEVGPASSLVESDSQANPRLTLNVVPSASRTVTIQRWTQVSPEWEDTQLHVNDKGEFTDTANPSDLEIPVPAQPVSTNASGGNFEDNNFFWQSQGPPNWSIATWYRVRFVHGQTFVFRGPWSPVSAPARSVLYTNPVVRTSTLPSGMRAEWQRFVDGAMERPVFPGEPDDPSVLVDTRVPVPPPTFNTYQESKGGYDCRVSYKLGLSTDGPWSYPTVLPQHGSGSAPEFIVRSDFNPGVPLEWARAIGTQPFEVVQMTVFHGRYRDLGPPPCPPIIAFQGGFASTSPAWNCRLTYWAAYQETGPWSFPVYTRPSDRFGNPIIVVHNNFRRPLFWRRQAEAGEVEDIPLTYRSTISYDDYYADMSVVSPCLIAA